MRLGSRIWLAALCGISLGIAVFGVDPVISGVVVERVLPGSEGQHAGLQAGDVLRSWTRGSATGTISSSFDLSRLETEQAPRGTVALNGSRGNTEHTWILGALA